SSPPSPKFGAGRRHTAAGSSEPVNSPGSHSADNESRPASAVATDILGRPPRGRSEGRTPLGFAGNPPPRHTEDCGMVSQADTHLREFLGFPTTHLTVFYKRQRSSISAHSY